MARKKSIRFVLIIISIVFSITGCYRIGMGKVRLIKSNDPAPWGKFVEDFPAITCDSKGVVWLALLDRPLPHRRISVYRIDGKWRTKVCSLSPPGLTGLGAPSIAPLSDGCVITFAAEQDDRWRIATAWVDSKTAKPVIRYLYPGGNANISPAVVVSGNRAWVIWVSNSGDSRRINACWISRDEVGKINPLSEAGANSYNPAVVARADGSLFAAWDSLRNLGADIYGAEYRQGKWLPERRLTSGFRIERHPELAVFEGQVWMTWQAQSYKGRNLNKLREQRVVVARIDGEKLLAPLDLFKEVSTSHRKLLRPQICFDDKGRLWLLVRNSTNNRNGWQALAWCYSGKQWTGPSPLIHQQGRWRPIKVTKTPQGLVAAVQYDDIYLRRVQYGWHSAVATVPLEWTSLPPVHPLQTQPLKMPKTDFVIAEKISLVNAELSRQTWKHNSTKLKLYWGNLHDHTDLSRCSWKTNPPGHDLFANVRDIERLDFAALTDHGSRLNRQRWAYNGEQTRANHDPGRFVTFLGQEWTSKHKLPADGAPIGPKTPLRYGHRNLIFLDPYHKNFYRAEKTTPRQLWDQLLSEGAEFITIPHQLADWKRKGKINAPTDWSFTDEHLQPVAEIFQGRQSYEYFGCPRQADGGAPFARYYLQDAWAKEIIIGVIASSDHGGGVGKVGVWAKELTREAIFEAIRARHCFGTSGAKMALQLSSGLAMMGDKIKRPDGRITFRIKAIAASEIKELVIFRNNQIVYTLNPDKQQIELVWTDQDPPKDKLIWYYARIQAIDKELAWTSPIWFVK